MADLKTTPRLRAFSMTTSGYGFNSTYIGNLSRLHLPTGIAKACRKNVAERESADLYIASLEKEERRQMLAWGNKMEEIEQQLSSYSIVSCSALSQTSLGEQERQDLNIDLDSKVADDTVFEGAADEEFHQNKPKRRIFQRSRSESRPNDKWRRCYDLVGSMSFKAVPEHHKLSQPTGYTNDQRLPSPSKFQMDYDQMDYGPSVSPLSPTEFYQIPRGFRQTQLYRRGNSLDSTNYERKATIGSFEKPVMPVLLCKEAPVSMKRNNSLFESTPTLPVPDNQSWDNNPTSEPRIRKHRPLRKTASETEVLTMAALLGGASVPVIKSNPLETIKKAPKGRPSYMKPTVASSRRSSLCHLDA